ncbi:MAG: hypothetical protein HY553_05305 [Elusimicrobia bacterium]|nr:hypothetical protein [Elusimicrobiota bacterium]
MRWYPAPLAAAMLLSACDPEQGLPQLPSADQLSAPSRQNFGTSPAPAPDAASEPRDPAFLGPADGGDGPSTETYAQLQAGAIRDAPNASGAAAFAPGRMFDGPGFQAASTSPLPRPAASGPGRFEQPFSVSGGRATVYYPSVATPRQRAIEGPDEDRLGRPLCTAEKFARGACDEITVAIDQRLHARYGTKVQSPQLEAAFLSHCRARGFSNCRKPVFAIRDTGACWAFKGPGHIDVATESNEGYGFGKAMNLSKVTLEFPEGLPRDPRLPNRCR